MKKYITLSWILVLFILIVCNTQAEIKLPSIFGDNMILQQKSASAIWGNATPRKTVKIITSWDKRTYSFKAGEDGSWRIKVNTPSAGGPYSITISDGKVLKMSNILIGEVWLCSGQSNMQMTMTSCYRNCPVLTANETIAKSTNKSIRLFTVARRSNIEPLSNCTGSWVDCDPGNVAEFSAVAYFFGRMVQEVLDIPVGIICSCNGGTQIEPWMSEDKIKKFDFVNLPTKDSNAKYNGTTPTVFFNAMINPIVGYTIKGAIWYQGESNRNMPKQYELLLPGLFEDWRNKWGIGNFPFYYAQIAPFDYGREDQRS